MQKALAKRDKNLFADIPHADLHCHGITSVPFGEFRRISPAVKLPPKKFRNLADFNSFLKNNIAPLVKNLDTVRHLTRAAFQRLINEGIVYTEMSFDIAMPDAIGTSLEEYLEMIGEEKERVAGRLNVCVEAGLDREINPRRLMALFRKSLKNNIFGSIDLYGEENSGPIEDYAGIYKLADKHNLKLKAHVGEFGPADGVKRAVKKLNLQAVQHGVSAAQDGEVMKLLARKKIPLNICPSSNLALGVIGDIKRHPIRRLFEEGVVVTVNSDDFSIFGKSAGEELIDLYTDGLFSEKEIARIIGNGLRQIRTEK